MRGLLAVATALITAALPAPSAADEADLHTLHCLHGCPVCAPANDDLIVRETYTLASNPVTRLADWGAYRVRSDQG